MRVPAELGMDATMLLHGHVSQPCRLTLAEQTSPSEIICKYLIWLSNSLRFCFVPPAPLFFFQSDLLILTFTHKGQLSPAPSTRTHREKFTGRCCKARAKAHHQSWVEYRAKMSLGIRGDRLQKVCPAVVVGGCGYLPCTKPLLYPSIHLCHGSAKKSWSWNKVLHHTRFWCTWMPLLFFHKKSMLSFPPGTIRLHFCERPFSTRADLDFSLFDKNVNSCYFFRCDQLWLRETFYFFYRLQKS